MKKTRKKNINLSICVPWVNIKWRWKWHIYLSKGKTLYEEFDLFGQPGKIYKLHTPSCHMSDNFSPLCLSLSLVNFHRCSLPYPVGVVIVAVFFFFLFNLLSFFLSFLVGIQKSSCVIQFERCQSNDNDASNCPYKIYRKSFEFHHLKLLFNSLERTKEKKTHNVQCANKARKKTITTNATTATNLFTSSIRSHKESVVQRS